jgi:beta-glucanase (GH16 family)
MPLEASLVAVNRALGSSSTPRGGASFYGSCAGLRLAWVEPPNRSSLRGGIYSRPVKVRNRAKPSAVWCDSDPELRIRVKLGATSMPLAASRSAPQTVTSGVERLALVVSSVAMGLAAACGEASSTPSVGNGGGPVAGAPDVTAAGASSAGAAAGGTTNGVGSTLGGSGSEVSGGGGTPGNVSSGGVANGGAPGIPVPAGYELVWHDEFDVDGPPNPANWMFEAGFVRNEEAQWYQPDNARVQGGMLSIEARRERLDNPKYTGKGDWKTTRRYAEYTSSSMHTRGLQAWQYGRFEMRGRIPTLAGLWPAWWTLGVTGEWPSNGEVDVMEFYQGKVLANVACGTSTRYEAKWDSQTKQVSTLGADWSTQFHVWRMDWDARQIALYLDDQEMNTATLATMLNPDGTSPFQQKAYMLVNLALGGMNGGDPSGTVFPQRYEVDYIRVYQRP